MQGLHVAKQTQLMRAAAGHRPAVFKAIRSGGTHTKSQLANQLDYLTTKSTHIVDSSGFLDGKAKLEAGDIKDLTERFAKRWDAGFKPKLGQTTHMLMSYPIGTRGEDVRDISESVAKRFFQTDEGHFDYIIAVHEDRDHPHAHLVLNRRSQEGEFFFLGRNHRFNYDDFRLAMVEEAEKYGVRLEATRRVDRGVVHYPARTSEVYAAKEEGRAPRERERVGQDLTRTLAEIANTKTIYHSLAAEASREAREDIAAALRARRRRGCCGDARPQPHRHVRRCRHDPFGGARAGSRIDRRCDARRGPQPRLRLPASCERGTTFRQHIRLATHRRDRRRPDTNGACRMTTQPSKTPRLLTVARAVRLTPNMIRVTMIAPDLQDLAEGCEGANCKIMLPEPGQKRAHFAAQLDEGPRPVTRTYTVRHYRKAACEIDIDFVDHGEGGPGSAWAIRAAPSAFCGFAGPGPAKIAEFHADWYLFAADMSALPVAAATLEAMPRDARGLAIFEILSEADRYPIDAPEGIVQHWLVERDPTVGADLQERLIRAIDWPAGRVQTCIAGESGTIKALRHYLHREMGVDRGDTYISGYWKLGLIEDEHQTMKRREGVSV